MRRETVYPGQVLPETVLLNMGRDVMTGMGKLMQDILGSGPCVSGFACTPTAPASLQVNIAPGNIYALQPVEASAWSTLPGDTAHTVLKQGILPDPVSLTLTPPTATGLAINYLVQVAYQDQDINPAVLPYYNSANPSQPFTGQGNNGQSQATARDGVAVVSLKAGIAAPSGNQQTPAPDTGNVGLWVITVLNGQTTVTAQNITAVPSAPYINPTMLGMSPSLIQSPAQFDKSTKLATTEFVQRAQGNMAGNVFIRGDSAIGYELAGSMLEYVGSGPASWTLPEANGHAGLMYMVWNNSGSALTLRSRGIYGPSASTTDSSQLVVPPGASVKIVNDATNWIAVDGATVTPPQFDKSTRVATTEFVQRAIGSLNGFQTFTTSPVVLNASHVGTRVDLNGVGSFAVSLPKASSVGIGSIIRIDAAFGPAIISPSGTDTLSFSTGFVPSVSLSAGDTAVFECISGVQWALYDGTVTLGRAPQFASSLSSDGWQKLPSGLIVQWCYAVADGSTGRDGALRNFPMSFPRGCFKVFATDSGAGVQSCAIWPVSPSQYRLWARDPSNGSQFSSGGFHIFAIGQ